MFDWGYFTEPEPGMDGRRIECARGKVVGGRTSINGMVYARGLAEDYDHWARDLASPTGPTIGCCLTSCAPNPGKAAKPRSAAATGR